MVTCIQANLNWFFLRTVSLAFLKLLRVVPFKTVFFFNGKPSTACSLVFGKFTSQKRTFRQHLLSITSSNPFNLPVISLSTRFLFLMFLALSQLKRKNSNFFATVQKPFLSCACSFRKFPTLNKDQIQQYSSTIAV